MAEEDIEFADMIVGDFEDTYDNLPLKTFLGYQFYHDFCQESLTIHSVKSYASQIKRYKTFRYKTIKTRKEKQICCIYR